jgi:hypothetical protein
MLALSSEETEPERETHGIECYRLDSVIQAERARARVNCDSARQSPNLGPKVRATKDSRRTKEEKERALKDSHDEGLDMVVVRPWLN